MVITSLTQANELIKKLVKDFTQANEWGDLKKALNLLKELNEAVTAKINFRNKLLGGRRFDRN